MSRTLLICRTLHQDKYSFQVFASWVLNVSFIEILQTCDKQSLHSIWMSFTTYLNSYLQIDIPYTFDVPRWFCGTLSVLTLTENVSCKLFMISHRLSKSYPTCLIAIVRYHYQNTSCPFLLNRNRNRNSLP